MFSFVWQYNDTFYSNLLMRNSFLMSNKIATIGQNIHQSFEHGRDLRYVTAVTNTAVILVIAPLVILYLFLQKFFMESIERSGIVG
jgi:multiple sugar transport system permease protein